MKEQFVPYEIAIKLKEKGFDEECLAFYYNNPNLPKLHKGFNLFGNGEDFINKNLKCKNFIMEEGFCNDNYIAAPLWQQVEDWLFDKGFRVMDTYYLNKKDWGYMVFPNNLSGKEFMLYMKDHDNKTHFKTKYEALQAAIQHALTLI